jgi:hypothetical protein
MDLRVRSFQCLMIKCPHCGNGFYRAEQVAVANGHCKQTLLVCNRCEAPVGATWSHDLGALASNSNEKLARLERDLEHMQRQLDDLARLLRETLKAS